MEKIKNLVKASPIAMAVIGLMVAGVASAALLTVYVTAIGTADVKQSVVFGNGDTHKEYIIGDSPAIAGNTYTEDYNLKNKSVTTAPIEFVTNQCIVGGGHCGDTNHDEDGVDTSYWSSVVLENKSHTNWTNWVIEDTDGTKGTLTYELASGTFNYEFEATGLTTEEDYSLIYYADKQDRFANPGGDNPGALIAEFTADSNGDILATIGSKNLAMNLPHADDWNGSAEANYCGNAEGDNFDLCRGAKIWLVPSDDYDEGTKEFSGWSDLTDVLMETDLITYDDTDTDTIALNMFEGKLNFFIKNVLDVALAPGEYKVKTSVNPVTVI